MLFLNEQGQMEILATEQHLLSMATDGILSLKNVNESQVPLRYEAISQSRFSILFAILDSHQIWRLRFRAVLTPVNGLLVFKLHSTLPVESGMYKIPQKERNVIGTIGLKPKSQRIDAMCSVFTIEMYRGTFGFKKDAGKEVFDISGNLDGYQPATIRHFYANLRRHQSNPLSTFREQRAAPAVTVRYFISMVIYGYFPQCIKVP